MELTTATISPGYAIRHRAFLRELGEANEDQSEPSARWRAVAAGLAVLRLLDTWVDDGMAPRSTLRATRATVDALPHSLPWRSLLSSVLHQLELPASRRTGAPFVPLFAYGRALEADAAWALAADVYAAVIEHAAFAGTDDLQPDAFHRAGYCARMLGDHNGAAVSYAEGRRFARQQGNVGAELRLRLSDANLMLHRGNLPAAAQALDQLALDADAARESDVAAAARHDRGRVAHAQGEFERAALLCYAAADAYGEARQRSRALFDLASCAAALGHLEVARRVNEVVRATSDSRELGWAATINLLESAIADGRETVFEAYRLELEGVALPAPMAASFCMISGQGYLRFGRRLLARQALGRALGIAVEAGLNQVTIAVDEELAKLDAATPERPAVICPPTVWSPEVERLAESVRRLHEEAIAR